MTTETPITDPAVDEIEPLAGERIHFLAGGLSLDTSPAGSNYWEPCHRGREIVLTATMIASTRDRLGRSWLEEFTGFARNRMWQSRHVLTALDEFAARAGRRGL